MLFVFCFFSFTMCLSFGRTDTFTSELISKPTGTKNLVSLQTGELSPEGVSIAHLTFVNVLINVLMKKSYSNYLLKKTTGEF